MPKKKKPKDYIAMWLDKDKPKPKKELRHPWRGLDHGFSVERTIQRQMGDLL